MIAKIVDSNSRTVIPVFILQKIKSRMTGMNLKLILI